MRTLIVTHRRAGFSLVEILVTVAIVGVMAGLAILGVSNMNEAAQLAQAQSITAQLNAGIKGYNQSNWDMPTAPDDSATTDEFLVLRSLQYQPPSSFGTFSRGAPFYPPVWNPAASTATTDLRVRWNGRNFQLLAPGTAGQGLKIRTDGKDFTFPHNYAAEYKPEGAR